MENKSHVPNHQPANVISMKHNSTAVIILNIQRYHILYNLVGGKTTPLKNDGVRQLGSLFLI